MTDSGDRHLRPDPNSQLGSVVAGDRSVAILADPEFAKSFAGQALLSLLVDLLARQFGVVRSISIGVGPANAIARAFPRPSSAEGSAIKSRLLALGRSVAGGEVVLEPDSGADATVVVWVGPGDAPRRGSSLTIRVLGIGWSAYCSTTDRAPEAAMASDVSFGPHLAACLAADRVFRLLRSVPVEGTSEIDLATLGTPNWSDPGPSLAGLVLPPSYLLGLGAVGAAFAYTMAATTGVSGALVGVDPQASDVSNRNRLLSMGYSDVEVGKADLIGRLFAESAIAFYPNAMRWPDYYTDPRRHLPDDLRADEERFRYRWILSAVDKNRVRRDIANILPRHVLSGSTDGLVAQATYYSQAGDCECLACNHPIPTYDVESLSADLASLSPEERRVQLVEGMGASAEEWAAVEDYLRDPACATVGEAALRRLGVEGTTDWSVGFVSAAAGVMLAGSFVRAVLYGSGRAFAAGPEARILFCDAPKLRISRARRKTGCPVCSDSVGRTRFANRWADAVAGGYVVAL